MEAPMPSTDPRIDAYIEAAAPFARPILQRLRKDIHAACPDVEETMKWSMPSFTRGGRILCHMAAFKQHCAFGYWSGAAAGAEEKGNAMGQYGRIGAVADLPPANELRAQIVAAARAMDAPGAGKRPARTPRAEAEMPDDLRAALDAQPPARTQFDTFSPSQRRDYIDWVVEAKREETRARRIAQAVEWIGEGKSRHWKYEKC
jgi:uncharacterized protein YdeI (YjbR/CyaY-like superfamily)